MNTVILFCTINNKKFYLGANGYWTTSKQEAQRHYESQVQAILEDHPFNHLHNCQYELA